MGDPQGASVAARLNQHCFCLTLDPAALMRQLDAEVGIDGFGRTLAASHPSLFSNVPVFMAAETLAAMARVVGAVEAAACLPAYRDAALAWAPPIARSDFGPVGALMGYDFHVTPEGPRLIEVNTNAGGAFINALLARSQRACCAEAGAPFAPASPAQTFETRIADMFVAEWRRQRGSGRPATIAIVDDDPDAQYLLPEFELAKALLDSQGFDTIIVDPGALDFDGKRLAHEGQTIDLVYNRLVDFGLEEERHAALQAAFSTDAVVVTPNPRVHALLADKRNLTLLSDPHLLQDWGLARANLDVLAAAVPHTVAVSAANADALWRDRRNLFFKPARGHGGKAAFRGEKLTRKTWAAIVGGDHVAQAFAAPSTRAITRNGSTANLKVDVRLYTYAGTALLAAARMYEGQTTNMRTPGGGFAPVLEIDP